MHLVSLLDYTHAGMNKQNLLIIGLGVVAILGAVMLMSNGSKDKENTNDPSPTSRPTLAIPTMDPNIKQYDKVPEPFLDENKEYAVVLHTTEGDIKIKLNQKQVPIAANNFAFLAKDGFYDGVIFHRVIKGFMIQGGDPTGTGMGGPGYKFKDESFTGKYTRGTVAYANSGPNTNGSQFFIMHEDYPLPPNYVIFGKVIAGMDTVDKIATAPVTASATGEQSVPVNPVVINSAELIEL